MTERTRAVAGPVAAAGVGVALGFAAAMGIPWRDAAVLVALSFGVALLAYGAGRLALGWYQSPVVVALIPVVSCGLGAVAAARAMFVSSHDLSALVVVTIGAGTAGVLGALTLARELAENRRRAAEAVARERAVDQSRRELVAWVSHDLRTPLSGIRAMAEALADGVVDAPVDVAEYHRRLVSEAERLSRLVDDLFELSRIESGALQLDLEPVSLDELVGDAVAAAGVLGAARGVRVDAHIDTSSPVTGSARELSRAIRNLLDNAVRHTPPGGRVHVSVTREGDDVEVTVADGCGGIPEDELSKVFEVAYRGDAARTPGEGGTGLGLAIARGFVEAHRGAIGVCNAAGGCRFTVRLPVG